jgi:hypothetical protein
VAVIKMNVHHKDDIDLKCPNNIPVHQNKIIFSKFMPESIPAKNVYSLLSSLASCAQLFGLLCSALVLMLGAGRNTFWHECSRTMQLLVE